MTCRPPSLRAVPRMLALLAASVVLLTVVPGPAAESPLPPEPALPAGARLVEPTEAATLVQGQAVSVLDIRIVSEVTELGRLPGAKHLDYFREDFDKALLEQVKLPLDRPVLVYCALGGRSLRAVQRLKALGFKEILVLKGGFNAWKKAGLPVEAVKKEAGN